MLPEKFSKPERAPGLPWQEIAGKVLLLQPTQRFAHELNPVASLIWKLSDGNHSLEQIVESIAEEFEVARSVAEKDTTEFLTKLDEKNLLL